MLILLLCATAFRVSSSIPLTPAINFPDPPTPLTIFGRELPDSLNPASHRTIQDLIWSCLATIFACTWVAVHPNVPKPCTSGWENVKERIMIMVCALLAPELITAWALRQRLGATTHMEEYNEKHFEEMPPARSIMQSVMDWFGEYNVECHKHTRKGPWTLTHGFLLEMGGLRAYRRSEPFETVEELPGRLSMSEAEINDKSKGDFLTKLFVVLQTTWFMVQVIARWITGLQVTELEVVTLGFAFLNIVTYALWWNKPQNMQVPIYIDAGEHGESEEEDWHGTGMKEDQGTFKTWKRIFSAPFTVSWFIATIPGTFLDMLGADMSSPFNSSVDGIQNLAVLIPMTLINLIFGGIHFIPFWTSSFSSYTEAALWMTSAVWIAAEPIFLTSFALADLFAARRNNRFLRAVAYGLSYFMAPGGWFYAFARVGIIALSFFSLRDLPPSAYLDVEWTSFIPHF